MRFASFGLADRELSGVIEVDTVGGGMQLILRREAIGRLRRAIAAFAPDVVQASGRPEGAGEIL